MIWLPPLLRNRGARTKIPRQTFLAFGHCRLGRPGSGVRGIRPDRDLCFRGVTGAERHGDKLPDNPFPEQNPSNQANRLTLGPPATD